MTMMNVAADTVAARLRMSRLLLGIDQTEMGHRLGVTRTTVSNWERGLYEPNVSQFISWAEITKQPAEQLLHGLPGCTPRDLNPEPTDYGCVVVVDFDITDPFWTRERKSEWYKLEQRRILESLGAAVVQ